MTQSPEDPIKALWREQETENPAMTVQAIRALARSHGESVRDQQLVFYMLVGMEAVAFGWFAWKAPNLLARAGELLTLGGLALMTWRVYLGRPNLLPDASASAGTLIVFHRTELVRRKNSSGAMIAAAAPALAGLLVTTLGLWKAHPGAPAPRIAPVLVLMVLWCAGAWVLQRRQARRMQQQIDELDAMARG